MQIEEKLIKRGYSNENIEFFKNNIDTTKDELDKGKLGQKIIKLLQKNAVGDDEYILLKDIKELILSGANLERESKEQKNTPLIICAKKNFHEVFKQLIEAGANIDAANEYQTTSLMWSARKEHIQILDDLILLNASLNERCSDGDSALHSAVRHQKYESVKKLIEAGSILNKMNNQGQTPIDIAYETRNIEIINLFNESIYNPEKEFEIIVQKELIMAKNKLKKLRQ